MSRHTAYWLFEFEAKLGGGVADKTWPFPVHSVTCSTYLDAGISRLESFSNRSRGCDRPDYRRLGYNTASYATHSEDLPPDPFLAHPSSLDVHLTGSAPTPEQQVRSCLDRTAELEFACACGAGSTLRWSILCRTGPHRVSQGKHQSPSYDSWQPHEPVLSLVRLSKGHDRLAIDCSTLLPSTPMLSGNS